MAKTTKLKNIVQLKASLRTPRHKSQAQSVLSTYMVTEQTIKCLLLLYFHKHSSCPPNTNQATILLFIHIQNSDLPNLLICPLYKPNIPTQPYADCTVTPTVLLADLYSFLFPCLSSIILFATFSGILYFANRMYILKM